MIKILHRYTKAVLGSSQKETRTEAMEELVKLGVNLAGADLTGANLVGAYLTGAKLTRVNLAGADLAGANLTGANLTGADLAGANLTGADLTGADIARANLTGTNLAGANLAGANLAGANLAGANLAGAYLAGVYLAGANLDTLRIVVGGLRSDGYRFLYTDFPGEGPRIKAGCRNFAAFAEAREHWQFTRGGTPLGVETMFILDNLERIVALH